MEPINKMIELQKMYIAATKNPMSDAIKIQKSLFSIDNLLSLQQSFAAGKTVKFNLKDVLQTQTEFIAEVKKPLDNILSIKDSIKIEDHPIFEIFNIQRGYLSAILTPLEDIKNLQNGLEVINKNPFMDLINVQQNFVMSMKTPLINILEHDDVKGLDDTAKRPIKAIIELRDNLESMIGMNYESYVSIMSTTESSSKELDTDRNKAFWDFFEKMATFITILGFVLSSGENVEQMNIEKNEYQIDIKNNENSTINIYINENKKENEAIEGNLGERDISVGNKS